MTNGAVQLPWTISPSLSLTGGSLCGNSNLHFISSLFAFPEVIWVWWWKNVLVYWENPGYLHSASSGASDLLGIRKKEAIARTMIRKSTVIRNMGAFSFLLFFLIFSPDEVFDRTLALSRDLCWLLLNSFVWARP